MTCHKSELILKYLLFPHERSHTLFSFHIALLLFTFFRSLMTHTRPTWSTFQREQSYCYMTRIELHYCKNSHVCPLFFLTFCVSDSILCLLDSIHLHISDTLFVLTQTQGRNKLVATFLQNDLMLLPPMMCVLSRLGKDLIVYCVIWNMTLH